MFWPEEQYVHRTKVQRQEGAHMGSRELNKPAQRLQRARG